MTRTRQAQRQGAPRSVSRPDDAAELQADRAADVVARGGSVSGWGFAGVSASSVHREGATKPEDKTKEAVTKAAEAAVESSPGQALKQKVLDDPLVKQAAEFVDTTAGKVVVGGAAAVGVGVLAATGGSLPVQPPKIPLDRITPGLSAQVKYEGPVNAPTFVGLSISYTEQVAPGKKGPGEKEKIAADTARLRAQDEMFRPTAEKQQQAREERAAAVAYMLARQRSQFGTATLVPLLPGTKPKSVAAPAEAPTDEKKDDKSDDAAPVQREPLSTHESSVPDLSGVDGALSSEGRAMEPAVRRSMEARFGYDFSTVRLHDGPGASDAAQRLDAAAFTIGDDIVLGTRGADPRTPQGTHLLAHELAHVVQQRAAGPGGAFAARVHRRSAGEWLGILFGTEEGDWSDTELRSYLDGVTAAGKYDGAYDADNKARAIVAKWKASTPGWEITGRQKGLLIDEMIDGPTLDADEQAILDLLELSDAGDLREIFREPKQRAKDLDDDFHGEEHTRLEAFLAARFAGGAAALAKGDVTVVGDVVPAKAPSFAFDAALLEQRIDRGDAPREITPLLDRLSSDDRQKAAQYLLHTSWQKTADERGATALSYLDAKGERKEELKQRLFALRDKLGTLKAVIAHLFLEQVPAGEDELRAQTKPVTGDEAKAAREAFKPKQYDPLVDDVIELDLDADPAAPAAPTDTTAEPPAEQPTPKKKTAAELKVEQKRKREEKARADAEELTRLGPESEYRTAIQDATAKVIDENYDLLVTGKGTHAAASVVEAMAEPAKKKTDEVFGAFYEAGAHPAMTYGAPGRPANLHSWLQTYTAELTGMSEPQRVKAAFRWILYYYQSESTIRLINDKYDTSPAFDDKADPKNVSARTLVAVANDLISGGVSKDGIENPTTVADRLLATKRNWRGMARGNQVFVDLYLDADPTEARRERWRMLQTLVHEYIHTLRDEAYEKYAKSFGANSVEWNTLIEGVDEVFSGMVWAHIAPQVASDSALRKAVEGESDAALPPLDISGPGHYDSFAEAMRLADLVGLPNLIAAYFSGLVDRIGAAKSANAAPKKKTAKGKKP